MEEAAPKSPEAREPLEVPAPQQHTVPIRYRITGRMPSVYAQNLLIQTLPEEIVLAFYETILPPRAEVTQADIDELKESGVIAECVARITLSPSRFVAAAEAMKRVADQVRELLSAKVHGNKSED